MYQWTQTILGNILVVFRKTFRSVEEAEEWNERTGICPNFILQSDEEIRMWEGEVIILPITNKRRRNNERLSTTVRRNQ